MTFLSSAQADFIPPSLKLACGVSSSNLHAVSPLVS